MKKLILLSLSLLTAASPVLAGEPWGEAIELAVHLLESIDSQEKPSEPIDQEAVGQEIVVNSQYNPQKLSPFDHIPDEILCDIFELLLVEYFKLAIDDDPSAKNTAKNINDLRLTCKRFNILLNDQMLFRYSLLNTSLNENSEDENSEIDSVINASKQLSRLSSPQVSKILKRQLKKLCSSCHSTHLLWDVLTQFLENQNLYYRVKKQLLLEINNFVSRNGHSEKWVSILDSKSLLELGLIKLYLKTLMLRSVINTKSIHPYLYPFMIIIQAGISYKLSRHLDQPVWTICFGQFGPIISYLINNSVKNLRTLSKLKMLKQ